MKKPVLLATISDVYTERSSDLSKSRRKLWILTLDFLRNRFHRGVNLKGLNVGTKRRQRLDLFKVETGDVVLTLLGHAPQTKGVVKRQTA